MYSLLKPLFFALDAETAHEIALDVIKAVYPILPQNKQSHPTTVMGLAFKNSVGLAAGLDKNADYIDALASLGFGFIEVGTVTPKAQDGNPKPRLFRLPKHESIINRMGFNNKGVDYLLRQVKERNSDVILGINIGKNLSTSVDNALDDYLIGLNKVYQAADYITVNISSPNTPGLRSLQNEDALESLLKGIYEESLRLQDKFAAKTPIALKIAPDLTAESIAPIADLLVKYKIDALIATNTTLSREEVKGHVHADQAGGLSGLALQLRSRDILAQFQQCLQNEIPIISAGGIDSVDEAAKRFELGAQLIQVYSALIFKGPSLVKQLTAKY
ncbi:MAG: quinone-dependent dihydroorotate dehydrogenase [Gammaproteobacteria bacterium]|nr:quinone-dependent dihydroorotate dehydrogenase [Gammaproteobacteria bacterium]